MSKKVGSSRTDGADARAPFSCLQNTPRDLSLEKTAISDVMWSVLNRERVSRVRLSSAFPMHLPLVEEARSRFVSKYVKHHAIFVVKSSGSRSSAIVSGAARGEH